MSLMGELREKLPEGGVQELKAEVRWMWGYIRRYWGTVVIHIVLGLLSILMGLGTSVASKYLIDAVTGYSTGVIGWAAGAMAGMLLGSLGLRCAASRIGAAINIRVHNELQAEVYRRILDTDWESLEEYRSGDLLHRLTGDVNTVSGGVTGFIPNLITSSAQFLGATVIMLVYDPTMAVIALLGVPVAAFSSKYLLRKMRTHSKKMKEISSDMLSFCEDSLGNVTSIKAFDITGSFDERMSEQQARYRSEYLAYNRFSVRTSAYISLVGMLVSAACFGWGVYRLWAGVITFGSMTMFLQLASVLSGAFSALIGLVSSAVSISTSSGRLMEIMELPKETGEGVDLRGETEISVEIRNADFAYHTGEVILKGASLEALPGELVALTGPSGEGKTTLLRMILGLIQPRQGSAVLKASDKEIPLSVNTRSAFAYVPQGNSMLAGTIESNLRLVCPDATEEDMCRALKASCAYDFVMALPGGLQYEIGGRGKGLSEGQAQRLAVARALLKGAPILLLDEATSALDLGTETKLLHNLMTGGLVRTCILVTHRTGALEYCTRRYRVENGKVEAW